MSENTRNPEPKELIGSKDLREAFNDGERIRGSFFINGIELHQFEANSPQSVVSQINAKAASTYVTAEIDDGGHLVLVDKSGADIAIGLGEPYVDTAPASSGDVAKDVLNNLKHEQGKEREKDRGNKVLEMLGLEATEQAVGSDPNASATAVKPGFETGRSAEERRKAHEEGNRAIGPAGGARREDVPQIPSNPTPGNSGPDGKLDDGRTGTGGGSGETKGPNVAAAHGGNQPGGVGQQA